VKQLQATVRDAGMCMLVAALVVTIGSAPSASTRHQGTLRARLSSGAVVHPLVSVHGPLVVAVGDVACPHGARRTATSCRDAATAREARHYHPRLAFLLGDEQYDRATRRDFRKGYRRTWGVRALKPITRPVPGNHEYETPHAAGYFWFFRHRTRRPGYYAFNVRNWRIYALNSNCAKISCRAENKWLRRDMTRHPRRCSALMMHHPLYSSGAEHGDSPQGHRFWVTGLRHHADLVLAGHDHDYERFRRMNASGHASRTGMVSFVVGTGGNSLGGSRGRRAGSRIFYNHRAGVLALRLGRHRFGWRFTSIAGHTIDKGIRRCV